MHLSWGVRRPPVAPWRAVLPSHSPGIRPPNRASTREGRPWNEPGAARGARLRAAMPKVPGPVREPAPGGVPPALILHCQHASRAGTDHVGVATGGRDFPNGCCRSSPGRTAEAVAGTPLVEGGDVVATDCALLRIGWAGEPCLGRVTARGSVDGVQCVQRRSPRLVYCVRRVWANIAGRRCPPLGVGHPGDVVDA